MFMDDPYLEYYKSNDNERETFKNAVSNEIETYVLRLKLTKKKKKEKQVGSATEI